MTALGAAPDHWQRTTIGEIADVRLGRQRSPKNHSGDQMRPYLRAANVDWYQLRPDDIQKMNFTDDEMETYALDEQDILIVEGSGSATEVGKCALVPERFAGHAFQNTLIRVRPGDDVDARWLMYRINAEAELGGFLALARGVGIFHLGSRRTGKWPIAVPPLDEQRAIVETIERTLSKLAVSRESLDAATRRLEQLQEASLHAALYGRLDVGSAQTSVQADWPREGDGVVGPDVPEGVTLPDGWAWASLDQIADVQSGAAKNKKLAGAEGCVQRPYLAVANVQRGYLDLDNVGTMWVRAAKLGDLTLRPGDVLFNEGGDKDKLGRGWVWQGQIDNCVHQNHVFRARLLTDQVLPTWLSHWGNVFGRWWFYERGSQTTGIASINKTVLRSLPVAVPPVEVQKALINEIERSSSITAAVAKAIEAGHRRSEVLRRSILKAAFEGRLTHGADGGPFVVEAEEAMA